MKLWAQIDPVVGAPLTPNKQTINGLSAISAGQTAGNYVVGVMALIIGIGFAFVALCDFILIVKVSSAAAVTRDKLRLSGRLRSASGPANSRPLSLIYPAAFTQYFPFQSIVLPLCVISLSPNHHHHHHHLCVIFCHLSSVCLIRPVS